MSIGTGDFYLGVWQLRHEKHSTPSAAKVTGTSPPFPNLPAHHLRSQSYRHITTVPKVTGTSPPFPKLLAHHPHSQSYWHITTVPKVTGTSPPFPKLPAQHLHSQSYWHITSIPKVTSASPPLPTCLQAEVLVCPTPTNTLYHLSFLQ